MSIHDRHLINLAADDDPYPLDSGTWHPARWRELWQLPAAWVVFVVAVIWWLA